MLNLTRKTDYALVALAYLGQRRAADEPPVSARQIAEQFGLPLALLMNILKELNQARLVTSTRGAQGGYALASDPASITLNEVVVAMEGPIRLSMCSNELPIVGQDLCSVCDCPIRGPVRRLNDRIRQFFNQVTLAELLESPESNRPGERRSACQHHQPAFAAAAAGQTVSEPH